MKIAIRLTVVFFLLLLSSFAATKDQNANGVDARRKQLDALVKDQWEYVLRTSPEFASILGDKRYNDKLSDFSQAAIERDQKVTREYLKKFEAIDTTGFPEQEKLNQELMVRNLRNSIEDERFKGWEMPVNQFSGIHIDFPQLISSLSFATVKDYDDFIARLKQFPRALDENVVQMRKGMKDNLMPPQILLTQVAEQAENVAKMKPEDTPFAEPLKKFPKDFSEADKKRISDALLGAVRDSVLPAYQKFITFVRNEYAPRGRKDIGIWSLPQGEERYRVAVKRMTTTDMTPEQIHQLGLSEVARIEAEQLKIAQSLRYNDLKAFKESLKTNAKIHPTSRKQIIDEYRTYTDQMWAKLPELFGRLPKAKLEVMPVPEYMEKQSSTHYDQGTPDGSRPGHVFVNTYDFANQTTISNESTAYHEGVPGHHMQIAIAQELPDLPPFRQNAFYTAYIEGWALYSERLGKEVGFYQDPYNDFGRLDDEILRAVRLVVDTGAHYKKWTREQIVQFMRDHTSNAEAGIQSETDRYIAWPGQALAYKVGQLTILRLREKAKHELSDKFDLRGFHDEVLGAGPLPLEVLEKRINDWIAEKKETAKWIDEDVIWSMPAEEARK
jgi:uncharacterized protein (DUF885 family)